MVKRVLIPVILGVFALAFVGGMVAYLKNSGGTPTPPAAQKADSNK